MFARSHSPEVLRWLRLFALMVGCFGGSVLIQGQTFTGSISGLVTDPSGAAVGGVKVIVTDLDRNTSFESTTNEGGFYLVAPVPPGRYRISAEKSGFRRYVLEPFPMSTQQKASVNIPLALGAVTESVTVSGSAQLLEASTSTLSAVIENKKIMDLPMNGRHVFSLASLSPGVYGPNPAANNSGIGEGFHDSNRMVVNGGRDSSNAVLLDGVPVTMNSNTANMNAVSSLPTVEGVQEFRVQTNSFSAEFGRSGGGVMTLVTKSGTNELHGSLFEFLRNSAMDANNWFANAGGRDLASFKRNEFGGSVGGPIILPKLYNGKDKTFFFTSYEGRRQISANTRQFTLPTDRQMAGDFSETLNDRGQLRVIYDPFSTVPDPNNPERFVRTPFPGNRIPTERLDPVARAVQEYYTARPNNPGLPFTGQNNFLFQGAARGNVNRGTAKVDHQISERQRMFVRYTIFNNDSTQPEYWPGPGCPDGGCFTNAERQQNAGLDYTNTLSPTSMLSIRYGFGRSILNRGSDYQGFRPSSLGLPESVEEGAELLVFPEFAINDMTPPGLRHHWNFRSANMSHTLIGDWNRVLSSHSIKVGGEARIHLINHMQAPWQLVFDFTQAMTQGPDPRVPSTTSGFGYASFLLGAGNNGQVVNGLRPALASKSYGFYLQDDWKVSRKLTLNLGLRWDFEAGLTERYDRFGVFDPDVRSPLSDQVGMELRGGWLFPDNGLGRRSLRDIEWNKVAPRIGLAYQITPSTVVRSGYGIFYLAAPYGANYYGTPPFTASTPWVPSLDGVTPYNLLNDPFPQGVIQPEGSRNGLLAAPGLGLSSPIPSTMTTPYNQQWNFTIQQGLGEGMAIEVAYAGNKGTKLPLSIQMDQLHPSLMSPENGLLDLVPNPFHGIARVGALSQETVQRGHLLTPYPQYPGVSFSSTSWGNSNFHSLQAKFEKRFSGGTSVMVAYTWGKLISDGGDNSWLSSGFRNNHCRACDRSLSPYDQRHRLVANFTAELPFGRGKAIGSQWSPWLNAILGQWQVNGIATLNSGLPLIFSTIENTSFSFGGSQRPDSTGVDANLDNPTIDRWFDTDQFTQPAQYTFGNVGRVHPTLRADRIENFDASLFKNFRITEGTELQFRAESFNLANHPIFASPNTQVGNVNFGRITSQQNASRQTQLALKILF
ncbi:MAG: TonB-dependent receptor domain-containing protein [Bryobacteraceae bacterium]